jgi:plastocyanin
VVKKIEISAGPTLTVSPSAPVAGQVVALQVADPPAGIVKYSWDLDGSGRFATDTGTSPRAARTYATPGTDKVAVRVATAGSSTVVRISFTVGAVERQGVESAQRVHRTPVVRERHPVRARAAADPPVSIVDFNFAPSSTTVHVGDTVTWTNNGQAPHTATANDGSFDTGTLQKGATGSHTFTTAGRFAYYCTIHPFMKGTVTVLAAASSSPPASAAPPASSGGNPAPSGNSGSSAPSGPTLPATGSDVFGRLIGGFMLLGAGVGLRRGKTRRP